jgi:putative flippase GtrA
MIEDQVAAPQPHVTLDGARTARPTGSSGHGRARLQALLGHRELRRFIAFLIAGGLSAVATITVTAVLTDLAQQRFLWSAIAGTELGILVNFTINDRKAFRDLEGHSRALPVRLVRFHVTCAVGQTLILLLSLVLHDVAHWRTVFAQAVPIALVTGVNFAMHRLWTYRGARSEVGHVEAGVPR